MTWPIALSVFSPLALALGASVGAVVGSFITTAGMRISVGRPWASGRSTCDGCRAVVTFLASVPILSYAKLGGRCRQCAVAIDPTHLAGEVAGLVIGVTTIAVGGMPALLIGALGALLLFIAVFDAKTLRIPNGATAAGLALALAAAWIGGRLVEGLITGASVFAALWSLRAMYRRVRHRDGLGLGDVKLLAALSVWLGPFWTGPALALAAASGLFWMTYSGSRHSLAVAPFGPFLAVGCWTAVVSKAIF